MTTRVFELANPEQTAALGARLGAMLQPGAILFLQGPLGVGKTTFVRGLAQGLGVNLDDYDIVSPSFTLLNIYPARIPLYHADAYRLNAADLADMELMEQAEDGVLALEWPKYENIDHDNIWRLVFSYLDGDKRRLRLTSPTLQNMDAKSAGDDIGLTAVER
jgi:tRNA threonylcarbamoyl adenosine modification protein YjeE